MTLRVALEEAKLESFESFDTKLNTTFAQIQVLHPNIDPSEMNLDMIVVEGQLVDPPREEDQHGQVYPLNLDTDRQELQVEHEDPLEVRGPELEQSNLEIGHQEVVMDTPNFKATP